MSSVNWGTRGAAGQRSHEGKERVEGSSLGEAVAVEVRHWSGFWDMHDAKNIAFRGAMRARKRGAASPNPTSQLRGLGKMGNKRWLFGPDVTMQARRAQTCSWRREGQVSK